MKNFIECCSLENAPTFYTILEEILDFLTAFIKTEDNTTMQEILTCFYLVSTMLNKNVVLYYENIVKKLMLLMTMISGKKFFSKKFLFDFSIELGKKVEKFKIFIYEISANIQKLFEIDMPKDIQF